MEKLHTCKHCPYGSLPLSAHEVCTSARGRPMSAYGVQEHHRQHYDMLKRGPRRRRQLCCWWSWNQHVAAVADSVRVSSVTLWTKSGGPITGPSHEPAVASGA